MPLQSRLTLAALAIGGLFLGAPAVASPSPATIYISSFGYSGTGCPSASVGSSFSSDRLAGTAVFDSMVASTSVLSLGCQLTFNLHLPSGQAATDALFDIRGYVQLPAGETATLSMDAALDGNPLGSDVSAFNGPLARDYLVPFGTRVETNEVGETIVPYVLNLDLALSGGTGQISIDSVDVQLSPVAEPASLALLAASLGALGMVRRARRPVSPA